MTPDEKIKYYKREWRRQIISVTGDEETAETIVELAYMNGLFDPLKVFFAIPLSYRLPLIPMVVVGLVTGLSAGMLLGAAIVRM